MRVGEGGQVSDMGDQSADHTSLFTFRPAAPRTVALLTGAQVSDQSM